MILQLGTGAFLRGFLDWLLHQSGSDMPLIVSGLTRGRSVEVLRGRELRYGHALRGLAGGTTFDERLTNTAITEACDPYQDWNRLRTIASSPDLRLIVTNATEAGMTWEVASAPNPAPEPFAAKVAALLLRRFHELGDTDGANLWVVPTELVEANGDRLRELVLRHADEWGSDGFPEWLDARVRFVNNLVDRIVSKAPTDEAPLAISSEPYLYWALENAQDLVDWLPCEHPGVVSVADLKPIGERKVRCLNGGHACLVFTGLLAGLTHVADALEHPVQRAFLEHCLRAEILPTLAGDPAELSAYVDDVLERFANPFLDHRLDAILLNSHAKVHVRLLPAMRDHVTRTGSLPPGLTTAFAAFLAVYRGRTQGDDAGVLERYQAAWAAGGVADVLADRVLYPAASLAGLEGLAEALEAALAGLASDVESTLAAAR